MIFRRRRNHPYSVDQFIPSAVLDLDATIFNSYSGSGQVWSNLVPAPADGSAKTAYDFNLGDSSSPATNDPTFTGSAGSPSAYFALDGGDYFSDPANTAFLNNLQKTTGGTDFWIATAFRFINSGSIQSLWGTSNATTVVGAYANINASNLLQESLRGDTAVVSTVSGSFSALVNGTDYLYIVSFGPTQVRQWLNSLTKVEATFTKNTCVNNPGGNMNIAARMTGNNKLANGSRVYAFSAGNQYIDNADAARIFDIYSSRHGRNYA